MDPLMDFTLSLQQSCVITVLNLILQQMNQNYYKLFKLRLQNIQNDTTKKNSEHCISNFTALTFKILTSFLTCYVTWITADH